MYRCIARREHGDDVDRPRPTTHEGCRHVVIRREMDEVGVRLPIGEVRMCKTRNAAAPARPTASSAIRGVEACDRSGDRAWGGRLSARTASCGRRGRFVEDGRDSMERRTPQSRSGTVRSFAAYESIAARQQRSAGFAVTCARMYPTIRSRSPPYYLLADRRAPEPERQNRQIRA